MKDDERNWDAIESVISKKTSQELCHCQNNCHFILQFILGKIQSPRPHLSKSTYDEDDKKQNRMYSKL